MRPRARWIAAAIVSTLLAASPAAALVLCQARDQTLFARTACHRKEKAVDLTAIGVVGATGAQGTVGPQGPPAVRVVDAGGHAIGPVTDTESFLYLASASAQVTFVLLKSTPMGQPFILGLDTAGNPTGSVSYVSVDCSGTPLVQAGGFLGLLQVVSDTVFYPTQTTTSATLGGSVETTDRSNGCTSITARGGCCRAQSTAVASFAEAATTTLAALGITPPLHAVAGNP